MTFVQEEREARNSSGPPAPGVALSVAIQTHPERAEMAAALADRIPGAELVVDPEPDGVRSPWRCYREALDSTPAWATHRLILQDDSTVPDGFLAAATAAVAAQPADPIVLFHGGAPRENLHLMDLAARRGDSFVWLRSQRWVPVVALVWPVALVCPAYCWVEEQAYPPAFRSDDEIAGRALRALGARVLATVPSLVQHEDRVPSLIGLKAWAGADASRVAYRYVGDRDPSTIDWSRGPGI